MSSTTTPVKTSQTALLAWQDVASGGVVFSSEFDCSGVFAASFDIRFGRRSGSAFTVGPTVRIEASVKTSGGDFTPILQPYRMALGSSVSNTVIQSTLTAGDASFAVLSSTNITAGDLMFLRAASTANYELARVKSMVSTTLTPEETVKKAHAIGDLLTDQAEYYAPMADLRAYMRIRAVCANYEGGQDISVQVLMTTFDSTLSS